MSSRFRRVLRGFDRDAVDQEVHELRTALDYAQAERDRAVAQTLAPETPHPEASQASATVQWLIETAEQDAHRIRAERGEEAAQHTERAEELLRHRVELIEQAQHEADVCRAQAAEEARALIHDALEKADALLRGLRESDAALREMFADRALVHRMPPPRRPEELSQAGQPMPAQHSAMPPAAQPQPAAPPAMQPAAMAGAVPEPAGVYQNQDAPTLPPGSRPIRAAGHEQQV